MNSLNRWTLPVIATACLLALPVYADIGPKPRSTAPGLELTGKDFEGINIEMTSEDVQLMLSKPGKDSALRLEVQVTFNMTNLGDAVNFEVGFPIGAVHNMNDFSVTTDGKAHDFELIDRNSKDKRKIGESEARKYDMEGRRDYWYVWNASYAAKTKCVHVVKYTLNVWHHSDWRHTGYILHTGAAWKNPIQKATVTLRCGEGLTLDHIYALGPVGNCKVHSDRVEWLFENFEPTEKDNIRVELNVRRTWTRDVQILREESKTYWSAKGELAHRLAQTPARNGRATFNDTELEDYLNALGAVISELAEKDGKWVMPADDPVRVYNDDDDTDDSEMKRAMRDFLKRERDLRSYAHKQSGNYLLAWFDRALDMAKNYPQSAKAKEVLGSYEMLLGHFFDGKLYAGTTKLELTHRGADKRLEQLRAGREEARKILGLSSVPAAK